MKRRKSQQNCRQKRKHALIKVCLQTSSKLRTPCTQWNPSFFGLWSVWNQLGVDSKSSTISVGRRIHIASKLVNSSSVPQIFSKTATTLEFVRACHTNDACPIRYLWMIPLKFLGQRSFVHVALSSRCIPVPSVVNQSHALSMMWSHSEEVRTFGTTA